MTEVKLSDEQIAEFDELYSLIVKGRAAQQLIIGKGCMIAIAAGIPAKLAEKMVFTGNSLVTVEMNDQQ